MTSSPGGPEGARRRGRLHATGDHSNNGLRAAASSVHAFFAPAYLPIRLPEAPPSVWPGRGFRILRSAGLGAFFCHQLLSLVQVSGRKGAPQGVSPY